MSRLSRRAFLITSAALGGIGVAGASGLAFVTTGPEEVVTRIVRYRLLDMRIVEADLDAFARDFLIYDRTSRTKLKALRAMLPIMQSDTLSGLVPARIRDLYTGFERRIVTKFILSTDVLQHAPGSGRPVTYLAFADPYLLGCANPSARFDLETI